MLIFATFLERQSIITKIWMFLHSIAAKCTCIHFLIPISNQLRCNFSFTKKSTLPRLPEVIQLPPNSPGARNAAIPQTKGKAVRGLLIRDSTIPVTNAPSAKLIHPDFSHARQSPRSAFAINDSASR